jgi:predicted nucleotidyltransferase
MNHQNNVSRIIVVAKSLGDLADRVVFVGGSTVSLYADRQTFEVRETDDVDVIVELLNYPDQVQFEEQLRSKGFSDENDSKVRGRFKIDGIIVDVMPTIDTHMGFENRWYAEGFKESIAIEIAQNITVKILSPPFFIATKFEAFKGRGKNDGRTSQDFEDIVYVLENRQNIWSEMQNSIEPLNTYLKDEFNSLLKSPYHIEWIGSHVERQAAPATDIIINHIKKLISN